MAWEVVNPSVRRGRFRVAVFDFDGTVSLIREGWAGIMAQLGLDIFRNQHLPYTPEPDTRIWLEDEMLRLSGQPSIVQMRRLGAIAVARGGVAPSADDLLAEFLRRLFAVSNGRKANLASGTDAPGVWAVPGSHALLLHLRDRGVPLYLVSGTDRKYVHEEAALLQLTEFFGDRIFAPFDNDPDFTKRTVIEAILRDHGIPGADLLGFGDGFSETVEVKRVGGVAVGVASQEAGVPQVNAMKRALLIELGADIIVADYAEQQNLVRWLFDVE